jgi:hypothetical protein
MFKFLKADRFWVMVGICLVAILKGFGLIESTVADPLINFGLGFIGVRTVDRSFEKIGGQ